MAVSVTIGLMTFLITTIITLLLLLIIMITIGLLIIATRTPNPKARLNTIVAIVSDLYASYARQCQCSKAAPWITRRTLI